nr:hypothetical protein CFP56_56501 [Quercus suber]
MVEEGVQALLSEGRGKGDCLRKERSIRRRGVSKRMHSNGKDAPRSLLPGGVSVRLHNSPAARTAATEGEVRSQRRVSSVDANLEGDPIDARPAMRPPVPNFSLPICTNAVVELLGSGSAGVFTMVDAQAVLGRRARTVFPPDGVLERGWRIDIAVRYSFASPPFSSPGPAGGGVPAWMASSTKAWEMVSSATGAVLSKKQQEQSDVILRAVLFFYIRLPTNAPQHVQANPDAMGSEARRCGIPHTMHTSRYERCRQAMVCPHLQRPTGSGNDSEYSAPARQTRNRVSRRELKVARALPASLL